MFLARSFWRCLPASLLPCKPCEEFSGSCPQPGGGLWTAWRLWEVTNATSQMSVGFHSHWGMRLPWESFWEPRIRKDWKLLLLSTQIPLILSMLHFIKMMTVMGLNGVGFAAVGIIYKWCHLARWQGSNMVHYHLRASPVFIWLKPRHCWEKIKTKNCIQEGGERDLCAKWITTWYCIAEKCLIHLGLRRGGLRQYI